MTSRRSPLPGTSSWPAVLRPETRASFGDIAKAAGGASEARELVSRMADDKLLAHASETQAQIALAQDEEAAAIRYVAEALTLGRATDNATASVKRRFLHPSENRPITLREAVRLQGVPAKYNFSLKEGEYGAAEHQQRFFPRNLRGTTPYAFAMRSPTFNTRSDSCALRYVR